MAASTTVGRILCSLASAYCVSLDDVLARHGVDRSLLDDLDARVPGQLDMDLFDELAARANEPALGIRMATLPPPLSYDLADYVARNSPDLESGYRCLVRYQRLLFDHPALELVVEGKTARLVQHPAPGLRSSRHAAECLLGTMVMRGRSFTGIDWVPLAVSLRDPPPADDAPYRRLFRAEVRFGQPCSEVVLDREVLAYPSVNADPGLFAVLNHQAMERLARLASPSTFIDELRRELIRQLRGTTPRARDISRRLGMGERTLHHRLRAEGRTYQQLLDEARLELARTYLADPHIKAVDVAFLLGFSDSSAFYRAFRRWTGMTPVEFRQQPSEKLAAR